MQENKKLSSETSELGNVDQIREILFGSQSRELNKRFEKLEIDIKRSFDDLKSKIEFSQKEFNQKLENEVGGKETAMPKEVPQKMKDLIKDFNSQKAMTIEDIIDFHYQFECIHPFQDGNGRVGRLIMLKECLRNGITPFIIEDDIKDFYYRGLNEWKYERGYLMDTCLTAQDRFKKYLDYYGIKYSD